MQPFSHPSRDFDAWASAVRQQMLESLARRRHATQSQTVPAPTSRQVRESDR